MGQTKEPGRVLAFTGTHRTPAVRRTKCNATPAHGPATLPLMKRAESAGDVDHLAETVGLALAQRFGGQTVWRRTMRPTETGLHVPCIAELMASGRLVLTDWRGKLIAELDGDEVRALVGRHL